MKNQETTELQKDESNESVKAMLDKDDNNKNDNSNKKDAK